MPKYVGKDWERENTKIIVPFRSYPTTNKIFKKNCKLFLFSLFLCHFQAILPWSEFIMVFLIFWIFLLFFWNFLLPFGKEQNITIIFIFSLSQPFPTYFGLELSRNGIFQFFEFFFYFFEIFPCPSGRNETER